MSLNRWAKARDANEKPIVELLRKNGLSVCTIDLPLDLLVGYAGRTYLAEVKTDKGSYTKPQIKFLDTWQGGHTLLVTLDDAQRLVYDIKRDASSNKRAPRLIR